MLISKLRGKFNKTIEQQNHKLNSSNPMNSNDGLFSRYFIGSSCLSASSQP